MADNNQLFNSKTEPIPPVRPELNIIPIENNGNSYLYFHDTLGYATSNFALDRQVETVLSLLDGNKSIEDLTPYLGEGVSSDQLLDYIRFLDENRLLHSTHLKQHASRIEEEYEASSIHQSVTAGVSFPADPEELTAYLEEAFSKHNKDDGSRIQQNGPVKALFAPHIDPRVGIESYVQAFSPVRSLKPKRVIILATSHYSDIYPDLYSNKPFIISQKNFKMPLGEIPSDRATIRRLIDHSGSLGVSGMDRAHRIEHSIELHLLFLSYLWNHDFRIVPILVRNFDELYYMEDGHLGGQIRQFAEAVAETADGDDETFFLISGDLSHIGRKFGDEQPATAMLNEVKSFDRLFMDFASKGKEEKLYNLMKEKYDPYRICGFAPLYTFLKIVPEVTGDILSYDVWDERERESAVSYGSILYS